MLKSNILKIFAVIGFVILAGTGGFIVGLEQGKNIPQNLVVQDIKNIDPEQAEKIDADFSLFWQAWDKIQENYLKDAEVTAQDKMYGAIAGLVNSLGDPYSEFFTPQDGKKFLEDVRGSFGGIGAEIGKRKDQLVIVSPLKSTPAMQAGLKAQDAILAIDEKPTEGLSVEQAVKLIRGTPGTKVTLKILRSDFDTPKDFEIIRSVITVPTLDYELKDGIAELKLYSFNEVAIPLLIEKSQELKRSGARGIILDLRNNPGGYLEVAIDAAGFFLKRGAVVVGEEGVGGLKESFLAEGNESLKDIPIVILVNGGSASASEILAGALRDNRNVKLIGEKTFGKGTVQKTITLKDSSTIKVTIAHWVLPSGKILEGDGLKPDIEIKPLEPKEGEEPVDVQMDRAREELKKIIGGK